MLSACDRILSYISSLSLQESLRRLSLILLKHFLLFKQTIACNDN